MKLKQEELDILENAPSWAECFIGSIVGNRAPSYANYGEDGKCFVSGNGAVFTPGWVLICNLADLRKRKEQANQQKIVDAVANLGAREGLSSHVHTVYYNHHSKRFGFGKKDAPNAICTIEEFNQCVKDMSKHTAPSDVFRNYLENKTPLEPKQKPAEWVNGQACVFTDREGAKKDCAIVGLFPPFKESYVLHRLGAKVGDKDSALFVSSINHLSKPVTKEKRWIAYNSRMNMPMSNGHKTKDECYNSMYGNRFKDDFQYIEIEVNV